MNQRDHHEPDRHPRTDPAQVNPPGKYPAGHGEADTVDRVAVWYSGEGWVRGLAATLPVVGSALDAIFGTYGSRLVQERQESMLRDLDVRVGILEADGAGQREFFTTEEGVDLLIAALVASARTRHKEKRRLYAAILAGATAFERPDGVEPEALLLSMLDLTPIEIHMLRIVHENRHLGWPGIVEALPPEAKANLSLHQGRLTAAGFLGTTQIGGLGIGTYVTTPTPALTALMRLAPTLGEDEPEGRSGS